MLSGIILAAGDSARMGSPKAVLPDRTGTPFVVRIATTLIAAGVPEVLVITGRHHDAIASAVAAARWAVRPRLVRNPDPARGQLSSLWLGLEACSPGTEAVAMTLVDVPALAQTTVEVVIETWRRTQAPIVRPQYRGRRGHPVIFDRALFDELRRAPLDKGARAVLSAHYAAIVNVPVSDPGCVQDLDTPEEYKRAMNEPGGPSDEGDEET